jgi:hypothetical protein
VRAELTFSGEPPIDTVGPYKIFEEERKDASVS